MASVTPPDDTPSSPSDPGWPKPEYPGGSGDATSPYSSGAGSYGPGASNPYGETPNPYGQAEPSSYGQSEQPGWGQPQQPAYGQDPYSQPDQSGYGQPGYGQPGYGQPAYGAPTYGGPGLPSHPSSTTALVLGLVALGGIMLCGGITLPLSPFAWWLGGKAVKEIDANPGAYSGRDQAQAGRIMGIVGTVLLVLGILAMILFFGAIWAAFDTSSDYSSSYEYDSDF